MAKRNNASLRLLLIPALPPHSSAVRREDGFTLIELSIVLVIIGLVVGGVLAGRDLIRAAQLRQVIREVEQFNAAVMAFQGKYNALPGDIPNATTFFGAKASCQYPNGYNYDKSTNLTCNGNGDGKIGSVARDSYGTSGNPWEEFLFWQHLALAGLVAGNFTGGTHVHGAASNNFVVGYNIPKASIGGGWVFYDYPGPTVGYDAVYSGNYGNMYFLSDGASILAEGNRLRIFHENIAPVLTPMDLYSIDAKIDDGKPGTGQLWGPKGSVFTGCTTSTNPAIAAYNIINSKKVCAPFFRHQF